MNNALKEHIKLARKLNDKIRLLLEEVEDDIEIGSAASYSESGLEEIE